VHDAAQCRYLLIAACMSPTEVVPPRNSQHAESPSMLTIAMLYTCVMYLCRLIVSLQFCYLYMWQDFGHYECDGSWGGCWPASMLACLCDSASGLGCTGGTSTITSLHMDMLSLYHSVTGLMAAICCLATWPWSSRPCCTGMHSLCTHGAPHSACQTRGVIGCGAS
jgi:hypothetical protein